jgi:hypothetical protein
MKRKVTKFGISSGLSGLSGLSGVGTSSGEISLDVIEANFNNNWLESYFTYGGPDEAASLDEIKFFDC